MTTPPTIDDLLRQQLGALLLANITLQAQLAAVRAENAELRAATAVNAPPLPEEHRP